MIPDDQKKEFIEGLVTNTGIILLKKNQYVDVGGNAVVIAPFIAITAAHIIINNKFSSFSELASDHSQIKDYYYPEESLNLLISSKKYKKQFLLNVARVTIVPSSDLAILFMSNSENTFPKDIWNEIEVCLTPPNLGEHVITIGTIFDYKKIYEFADGVLEFNPQYMASIGSVIDFKEKKFGQNYGGFYAELTNFNTLSGSPVYNKDKQVVGLVSQGFDSDKPTAFVPILYPLFISNLKWDPISSREVEPYRLYDLVNKGVINCVGVDTLEEVAKDQFKVYLPKSLRSE